jgi:4-amino-4-deoxy-L-arabinose transferase-like glycosyltransferase
MLSTFVFNNERKHAYLFFLAFSSFFFIGLGKVHLFDWDEINFAESAREMISSGDYLKVQINYKAFWEKPPLFFWLQVLAMKMFGVTEFSARVPNAFFGFLYLITFYEIGRKHFSATFGLLWSMLFAGCFLPHLYFKSGIIDPVFNYFIFLSIYFFMLHVENDFQHKKHAFLAGVFSSMSVLTKGPVGLLLFLLTVGIYFVLKKFKSLPRLKTYVSFLAGFSVLFLSWVFIEINQNGWSNLERFIQYQIELFTEPVAGHEQPFFYHFVVVLIGCFPISIIGLRKLIPASSPTHPFFIKWMSILFWVVLILFSITKTKIVHYSSMTYIPLSFIAAYQLLLYKDNTNSISAIQRFLFLFIGILWSVLLILTPLVAMNKSYIIPYLKDPFAIEALKLPVSWSGMEVLPGLFFLLGFIYSYKKLLQNNVLLFVIVNLVNISITLLLFLMMVLPKIEQYSQKSAIDFIKSKRNETCYVETYGYKSYAQYFYSEADYEGADKKPDVETLINKDVQRPVYLISKINNPDLDSNRDFTLLYKAGGFKFYKKRQKLKCHFL